MLSVVPLLALQPAWGVLVFSRTAAFRHDSIETGQGCFQELGAEGGFSVDLTEDASVFTDENLGRYKAVVFLNTTGDVLNMRQQASLKSFVVGGGGYVGVHAAADTEYDWPWYGELVGAYFLSHPRIQQARVLVTSHEHPATSHLPSRWDRTDEWYDYRALPVKEAKVLCKLDTSTYEGSKMGENHPIVWCRDMGKGRSFYTGFGHTKESYSEPWFRLMLKNAVVWAAGAGG